jgi:predicted PurR-regulated permease PerM
MMQFVQPLLAGTYSALAYLGFIAVLVVLGLPAIGTTRNRIVAELEAGEKRELLDVVEEISSQIRDYVAITTLMSILTGAVTAGCAFAFGLDLAISWGLLNFLLNYVPLVGNIIGIIPPVLYALLQFDGWIRPVGLFAALAVLQLVISNFVYPMAQGRSLALPPVVILLALTFWSWIWGVAGALIALPLTVTAIIICRQFGSTRWIATLLSSESD